MIYLDVKDKRLGFVKEGLTSKNIACDVLDVNNFNNLKPKDVAVLSPAFKWNEQLVNSVANNITVIAGAISEEFKAVLSAKNVKYINVMANEDFVLKNATLTAEGMLCDLILNTPQSMYSQNILIIGSGRVAKAVAYLFFKLGLKFDMAMRNEVEYNHNKLIANKCFLWHEYKDKLKDYDCVINTVPVQLFEESDLDKFKKGSYVFELASKKCFGDLQVKGFTYVLCPALPAKYTPQSAGELILEIILDKLQKGEI